MGTPELNKALAAVQAVLKSIAKGETAEVKHKDTGRLLYTYSYADLPDVSDAILPLLGTHGLAYTCEPTEDDQGRLVLDYALLHESGQERAKRFPLWLFLPDRFTAQTAGGLITFFRRYCLQAVTGLSAKGEDDDAQEAAKSKPRPRRTPTATTGRDHEELREGAVERAEGDRPATRTRGPVPDDENTWQAPPGLLPEEQAGSVTKAQLDGLHASFTKLGATDRGERLQVTEKIIGRELTGPKHGGRSSSNLSYAEAAQVKRRLGDFAERAELIAFMAGEAVTT